MTVSILNLDDVATLDIVSLSAVDKADLVCVPVTGNGLSSEAIYKKVTGRSDAPLSIRVGLYPNPTANGGIGQTNTSIKVRSYVENVEDSETIWTKPGDVTLAWTMPGNTSAPDKAGLKAMIATAFTMALTLVSGEITDTNLDLLSFGIVIDLHETVDTPSA